MKALRITIICLLFVSLFAATVHYSTCATTASLSVNKGCGSTYGVGEMVVISYKISTSSSASVVVSLWVNLPDGSDSIFFTNRSILPNVTYYASGVASSLLGTRTVVLEYEANSSGGTDAGAKSCIYTVSSSGGGGGTGGGTVLRIDSNVSNFQVWWNGVYNHTTPYNYAMLYSVPSGTHTVTLKKSGCQDASKTITIIPGLLNTVTINMDCGSGGGGSETPDIDGDGVPDDEDGCYNPDCNIVDSRGCPKDQDRDGVNDCDDRCPSERGTPSQDGCPAADRDNDGVTDDTDACYNPGCTVVNSQGCPLDSDSDGLDDCEDECPQSYGERRNDGCPEEDADSDGVPDGQDSCYNPGCTLVDSRGCPWDSDSDGLNDCEDNCPNQSGPRNNNGCPEQQQGPQFCLGTVLLVVLLMIGGLVTRKKQSN
ncbi:MAG: thrombospondin type 3 repeat-containing protein [Theionarchaea archaeon]|nr:thrombospondin type 3 repeat-containing protein [Theionarchaea archaeon]